MPGHPTHLHDPPHIGDFHTPIAAESAASTPPVLRSVHHSPRRKPSPKPIVKGWKVVVFIELVKPAKPSSPKTTPTSSIINLWTSALHPASCRVNSTPASPHPSGWTLDILREVFTKHETKRGTVGLIEHHRQNHLTRVSCSPSPSLDCSSVLRPPNPRSINPRSASSHNLR